MATRYTASGTHQGDLMGIVPTSNRVTITGIAVDRLTEGKIEESWDNYDALSMMLQLGVVPAPEQQAQET